MNDERVGNFQKRNDDAGPAIARLIGIDALPPIFSLWVREVTNKVRPFRRCIFSGSNVFDRKAKRIQILCGELLALEISQYTKRHPDQVQADRKGIGRSFLHAPVVA